MYERVLTTPGYSCTIDRNSQKEVLQTINKIRSKADIHPERFDQFIEFSHDVQNICATIRACKMYDYLNDGRVLQQLIDKIPVSYTINWATYRVKQVQINIDTLEEWLGELAESLYGVSNKITKMNQTYKNNSKTLFQASQFEKVQDSTNDIKTNANNKNCILCQQDDHKLSTCSEFNKKIEEKDGL